MRLGNSVLHSSCNLTASSSSSQLRLRSAALPRYCAATSGPSLPSPSPSASAPRLGAPPARAAVLSASQLSQTSLLPPPQPPAQLPVQILALLDKALLRLYGVRARLRMQGPQEKGRKKNTLLRDGLVLHFQASTSRTKQRSSAHVPCARRSVCRSLPLGVWRRSFSFRSRSAERRSPASGHRCHTASMLGCSDIPSPPSSRQVFGPQGTRQLCRTVSGLEKAPRRPWALGRRHRVLREASCRQRRLK